MRTVAEVAEDVWTRILEHSELADVLSLEQVRLRTHTAATQH